MIAKGRPGAGITRCGLVLGLMLAQRQWRANGRGFSPDPAKSDPLRTQHDAINAAYRAMLTTLGQSKWIDEVHKAGPSIRRR